MAPAYDITYAHGTGFTKYHQMTINGKNHDFSWSDILSVASVAHIFPQQAKSIYGEIANSASQWNNFASQSGLSAHFPVYANKIKSNFVLLQV